MPFTITTAKDVWTYSPRTLTSDITINNVTDSVSLAAGAATIIGITPNTGTALIINAAIGIDTAATTSKVRTRRTIYVGVTGMYKDIDIEEVTGAGVIIAYMQNEHAIRPAATANYIRPTLFCDNADTVARTAYWMYTTWGHK